MWFSPKAAAHRFLVIANNQSFTLNGHKNTNFLSLKTPIKYNAIILKLYDMTILNKKHYFELSSLNKNKYDHSIQINQ